MKYEVWSPKYTNAQIISMKKLLKMAGEPLYKVIQITCAFYRRTQHCTDWRIPHNLAMKSFEWVGYTGRES